MKSLTLFLALMLGGAWLAPAQTPEDHAEIDRLRQGLVDGFNRGDIDKLVSLLDTNVVVTWQNGEVCVGRAAVKAYYERMMKGDKPIVRKVTAEPKVLDRHFYGDWAVSWGELNDHFELTDGRHLNFNSHFTATIARRGDHWEVVAFHASVNVFDNPVLSLAIKKVTSATSIAGAILGVVIGMVIALVLRRSKVGAT